MERLDFTISESMRRSSDPPIKITREIPLFWVLSVIGMGALFAVTVYFTQLRQSELIIELTVKVQRLTEALESRAQKDAERDYKLSDLDRRLSTQELMSRGLRK